MRKLIPIEVVRNWKKANSGFSALQHRIKPAKHTRSNWAMHQRRPPIKRSKEFRSNLQTTRRILMAQVKPLYPEPRNQIDQRSYVVKQEQVQEFLKERIKNKPLLAELSQERDAKLEAIKKLGEEIRALEERMLNECVAIEAGQTVPVSDHMAENMVVESVHAFKAWGNADLLSISVNGKLIKKDGTPGLRDGSIAIRVKDVLQ